LFLRSKRVVWSGALFETQKFFEIYPIYLRVDCLTRTESDFLKWTGRVESQIRFIVRKLEEVEFVAYAHPNTVPYDFKSDKMPFARAYFVGLRFDEKSKKAMSQANIFIPILKKFNADKVSGVDTSVNLVFSEDLPHWVYVDGIPPKPQKKLRTFRRKTPTDKNHNNINNTNYSNSSSVSESSSEPASPADVVTSSESESEGEKKITQELLWKRKNTSEPTDLIQKRQKLSHVIPEGLNAELRPTICEFL